MVDLARTCRNERCREEFTDAAGYFCPSCRLAIAFGLKVGALIVGPVAGLLGLLIGWLQ